MKNIKKILGIIALSLFLPMLVIADAPPAVPTQTGTNSPGGIPCLIYGSVGYENGVTPDGLSVEAKIDGVVVKSSTTLDGKYGYSPNLFKVLDPNSNFSGKIISFFVNGIASGETTVFDSGASIYLDLSMTGNAPGYVPADTGGGGTGGGGGGGILGFFSASASEKIVGDVNGDSKVDKYDFALMMSAWGQTGSDLAADLNSDGKVDKYDFSLLMLNWGK